MPVKDYSYEWMLDRLYSAVPVLSSKYERFEVPKVKVVRIGEDTIVKNFKEMCDVLRREPRLVMRYLLKELAAPGNITESGELVIHGKFSAHVLNMLIDRFVKAYVICPTCGRPDTHIIKQRKAWILRCDACGAESSVRPF